MFPTHMRMHVIEIAFFSLTNYLHLCRTKAVTVRGKSWRDKPWIDISRISSCLMRHMNSRGDLVR